jgi:LPXTG-motif cell wall-anchored protein
VTTTTSKHVAGSTVAGQGTSTSFGPPVSSTSVFKADDGGSLPFTGSSSTPLVALGVVLLATGLTLTLSQARRRERTQS